jgi:hypothetical protein
MAFAIGEAHPKPCRCRNTLLFPAGQKGREACYLHPRVLGAGLPRIKHPSIGDDRRDEAVIDRRHGFDKTVGILEPARDEKSMLHGGHGRKLKPKAECRL